MRTLPLLALVSACTSGPGAYTHMSELEVSARGLAFDGDSASAVVGMFGTTCTVDPETGRVGADYDYPSETEVVADAGNLFGVDSVVVTGPDVSHVTVVGDGGGWADGGDIAAPGVTTARLFDGGVVGAFSDCSVSWSGEIDGSTRYATGDCAGASLSVTEDGVAWVSHPDHGTYRVDASGAELVSMDAVASWDRSTGLLYTSDGLGGRVRALDATGAEIWSHDTGGAVFSVAELGSTGRLAAVVSEDSGVGELLTLDGATGTVVSALRTPTAASFVRASADGEVLAVGLPREVHFFRASGR